MLDFFLFIARALRIVQSPPSEEDLKAEVARVNKARGREIVRRFSRGNVLLQQGRYVTEADINHDLNRQSSGM